MNAKVLVAIPAFNEERRIGEVVEAVRRAFPEWPALVVNDGSRDATARAAAAAGALVVSHSFNLGYGAAVQTAYRYALAHCFDIVVQIDGDGQHDPASIPALVAPLLAGEADLAIGSRFLSGQSYRPPVGRRICMWFFRRLVSCLIGQEVTDTTTGYQALNSTVLHFFCTDVFPADYPDADLLIAVHRAGFLIAEVPVRMSASAGKSMHSGLKPLYYMVKMLLSIFVTLLREKPRDLRRERSR